MSTRNFPTSQQSDAEVLKIVEEWLESSILLQKCLNWNVMKVQTFLVMYNVFSRWMRRKRLLRPRTVSDSSPRVQIQPLPLPPISNSEAQAMSRSSSRSSGRTKTNSLKGAAAVDLNGSMSDRPSVDGTKINNVNLVSRCSPKLIICGQLLSKEQNIRNN